MKRWWLRLMLLMLCVSPALAAGAPKDIEGSKDHPLIKRYEGAVIVQHDRKTFDEYTLPLGKVVDRPDGSRVYSRSAHLEGEITRTLYVIPEGRSTLEVMRNYERDLKDRGCVSLYSATGREAEGINFADPRLFDRAYARTTEDFRIGVWKLDRAEGDAHIVLYAFASIGDASVNAKAGQTMLYAHVIVNAPMETNKLIKLGAEEMATSISTTGRVALYGVYFDTNRTEIKPESEPTLQEIAKLLKAQPSLKLLVVGHTDNVGTFASNMDLSQRRAQAVVNTLVSKYGVGKERLTPFGDSFAAPVASNKTEEGRAKNRRVELVEQ